MSSIFITDLIISSALAPLPFAEQILNSFLPSDLSFAELITLSPQTLEPSHILSLAAESLFSPFMIVWDWLLFNMLTPLILIIVLVAFFVGQYYLLKLYIFMIKNTIVKGMKLAAFVSGHKKFKSTLNYLEQDFLKFHSEKN